jgi:hypothetical protein
LRRNIVRNRRKTTGNLITSGRIHRHFRQFRHSAAVLRKTVNAAARGARARSARFHRLNEAAVAALELVARQGVPAGASMVDGGLGMIRQDRWCSRISGDILGKTISKQHRRGSTRIFCNPNALVSPLWVECRGQAHNVEVAIGDLFATRNPLKSQAARKVLSPISQHSCHHVQVVRAFKVMAGAHPI